MMEDHFDRVVYESEKGQIRLVVSEFRDNLYLSLRWYYLDFEGEWKPTKEGITIPYELASTAEIFRGFVEILAETEVLDEVMKHAETLTKTE